MEIATPALQWPGLSFSFPSERATYFKEKNKDAFEITYADLSVFHSMTNMQES